MKQGLSESDKVIAQKILCKTNTARRAAETACLRFDLGSKDEIIAKAITANRLELCEVHVYMCMRVFVRGVCACNQ